MRSPNNLIDKEPLARPMKTRIGLAATLMLAVVLALGPTGTPAAAAENAVVHWSGIAEGVIAFGRPSASRSVLAGMVHGAGQPTANFDSCSRRQPHLVPLDRLKNRLEIIDTGQTIPYRTLTFAKTLCSAANARWHQHVYRQSRHFGRQSAVARKTSRYEPRTPRLQFLAQGRSGCPRRFAVRNRNSNRPEPFPPAGKNLNGIPTQDCVYAD